MKIFKGAESLVYVGNIVRKVRNRKKYRVRKLDEKIRLERTRREFKILTKVNKFIPSPFPIKLNKYSFTMSKIEGTKPTPSKELASVIGKYLSILHSKDIIHGDLTPANIIKHKGSYFVIDFGLSFVSKRIEDKADDLLTSLNSLKRYEHYILSSYSNNGEEKVINRMKEIKKRARYI